MTQTALYRHFDTAGRLLYVGISSDPFRRLKQHLRRSAWQSAVVTVKIDRFCSRQLALSAEAEAIKAERPRYNIRHQGVRKRPDPAKERALEEAFEPLRKVVSDHYRALYEKAFPDGSTVSQIAPRNRKATFSLGQGRLVP